MRSSPLRLTLGIVGLALAVYAVASLTGGWLGTPPWTVQVLGEYVNDRDPPWIPYDPPRVHEGLRHESDWISRGVVSLGLALVAFAAWPHRSRPRASTSA